MLFIVKNQVLQKMCLNLVVEEWVFVVGLSPGVLVHVDSPEVVADGEEEGKVVAGDHQQW